ncbi:MAG: Hsp20/alpha crystallin family protein, partial [Deltaproteobacteria bacterium]|nr:Hsp20/alpha crystallin family protein [Deltaproteobacteria bacterium]
MADKAKEKENKAVTPWRPAMDLARWERDMDRMMEDFFGRRMRSWRPERWFEGADMELRAPAVDLYEEKDDIVVKAELPGIEKDNLEVNLTDHNSALRFRTDGQRHIRRRGCWAAVWGGIIERVTRRLVSAAVR